VVDSPEAFVLVVGEDCPDANGIKKDVVAKAPVGPIGPVSPVAPVAPVGPFILGNCKKARYKGENKIIKSYHITQNAAH